jgi:hypothetical protein
MIAWGDTPLDSVATIYWPQLNAADVLQLANQFYAIHHLSVVDNHTIQCPVTQGMTFVPIPPGTAQNIAGLFTVDLPATVKRGQEFDIVIRRISTRQIDRQPITNVMAADQIGDLAMEKGHTTRNWRYVIGTFQVKIPVETKQVLLLPEENTLAIFKWRLSIMSPKNRWYSVLERYVSYVEARVLGLGCNPASIPPSPDGYVPYVPVEEIYEYTGKVSGIVFDRFGDFEGFLLMTESGIEHSFRSMEEEIEALARFAWEDRVVISVVVSACDPKIPVSIVLRRAPHQRRISDY